MDTYPTTTLLSSPDLILYPSPVLTHHRLFPLFLAPYPLPHPILSSLQVLAERFQLDSFEKKMICLLIGKTVSSVVRHGP